MEKQFRAIVFFLAVFALALGAFYAIYRVDNKYTAPGPQPVGGILRLDDDSLSAHPVLFLVQDWAIYRDRLYPLDGDTTPLSPLPDEYVFIGQYRNFGVPGTDTQNRPHGSATYRLTILLPDAPRNYTLELPEIYSAYRLYINGVLMKQMGNPDPSSYRPLTDASSVMVQASGRLDIIIAVTDYDHFNSGMMHPPAFGETEGVTAYLGIRLILRTAGCIFVLCFALLSLFIGLLIQPRGQRGVISEMALLYAGLCFVFAIHICYPVLRALAPTGPWFYAMENFAWCGMLVFSLFAQKILSGLFLRWSNVGIGLGCFAGLWALLTPLFWRENPAFMDVYAAFITLYTWVIILYLTFCAVKTMQKGAAHSRLILAALLTFDAALVIDSLCPLFEPIRLNLFRELAGGILVLSIGIAMLMEMAALVRMRQAVESRAENVAKMLEVQKTYYPVLLEQERSIRAARHDLRHHIVLFRVLLARGDCEGLMRYLEEYSDTQPAPVRLSYCGHYVCDMLLIMYRGLAEQQDTAFRVQAAVPDSLPIRDVDLCVMLSNLLENALEASTKLPADKREIVVRMEERRGQFLILVENSFDGSLTEKNGGILSSKKSNRLGVGLVSVRAATAKYGGETAFYREGDRFFSEIYIPTQHKEA